nr:protein FAR1-related sequence 5-like [Tanacetum cinerariifolium]
MVFINEQHHHDMVESSMVRDHDMEESSMVRDHDMGESLMVQDHDMVDSSMVRDDQVDNQIVVLPEDLQHPESFSWMLEAFLKTHKKHPPFAVTDQDGALRNVVVKMFPDSHHRLCMWHITEKLPGKVLGDLAADNKFRKDFL